MRRRLDRDTGRGHWPFRLSVLLNILDLLFRFFRRRALQRRFLADSFSITCSSRSLFSFFVGFDNVGRWIYSPQYSIFAFDDEQPAYEIDDCNDYSEVIRGVISPASVKSTSNGKPDE